MSSRKRVVYLAYNGLTPELQSVFSEIDATSIDMAVVVADELDLFGQRISYATAPRVDTVRYVPMELARNPYDFFLDPRVTPELDQLLSEFEPDLIVSQAELVHSTTEAVIRSSRRHSPRSKIMAFVARRFLPSPRAYARHYVSRRLVFRGVDFLCCRSRGELALLAAEKRLARIKLFYNYWGTDPGLFRPLRVDREDITRRLGALAIATLPEDSVLLGFIGRVVPEKGLHLVLEALSDLPERYHFIYCGYRDSSYGAALDEISRRYRLSDRVHYLGNVPYEAVPHAIALCDLLILPTFAIDGILAELFGRVIPEAMLCKTPVIGSDNGSIPEVLHNPALVFRQNDPASLRDKIISYFDWDDDTRTRIADDNYRYALEHYTSRAHASRFQAFALENI